MKLSLVCCALLLSIVVVLIGISPSFAAPSDHLQGKPLFLALRPNDATRAELGRMQSTSVTTVAHWSSSFSFNGVKYSFSMVGTSPFAGSATTTVSTEIQPLTFVFSNGMKFSAPSTALANSPMFQSTTFPSGTGQYADVIQRANFASPVSTKSPNYHVLLGQPHILAAKTINVPAKDGKTVTLTTGRVIGLVNINFITSTLSNLIAAGGFNASTLPIFLVGNVFEYINSTSNCCVIGFHDATSPASGEILSYIYVAYNSPGIFTVPLQDITAVSHEVAEWVNDPFVNNVVPKWGQPNKPSSCFSDLLEVGDPIEVFNNLSFTVKLNGISYHPQDEAFFSWFAHQSPSIGRNGQYSYITPEKLTSPPSACH